MIATWSTSRRARKLSGSAESFQALSRGSHSSYLETVTFRKLMATPVYHLYTIGWKGDDIFIGSFSTLENAYKHFEQMCLRRRTWIELDVIDNPVDEQNIVWEISGTFRRSKQSGI